MRDRNLIRALVLLLSLALPAVALAAPLKPRIGVLTDISPTTVEPDDFESTIRLLVHADLFEIEGLVATTGWSNSGGRERPDIIRQIIDAYEKDLPNLRKISGQAGHLGEVEKRTSVQFSGDSKKFAEQMAKAWGEANQRGQRAAATHKA